MRSGEAARAGLFGSHRGGRRRQRARHALWAAAVADSSTPSTPSTPAIPCSVGDYQKAGCMAGLEGNLHSFQLDADF